MKKLFLAITCVLFSLSVLQAQDDCFAFFPSEEGTLLISKTYDAGKNLISTMTYRINESYDYGSDKDIEVGFTLTNGLNTVVDQGTLSASCQNGNFYLRMENRSMTPEAIDLLVDNAELVGDFLDYPNTFSETYPFTTFEMDGGEYTIRSKTEKKDLARVRVYNRDFIQNEKVTTPAGTFDAAKVTFNFDVDKEGAKTTYKGVEWYAIGAGIVRSETYTGEDVLVNYTELTELRSEN